MATSGQTLNDRINAARYALAGQGLARCVCKATTEEVIGPKKKHLDYLLACTHEPNVSIPQLANLLIERTNHIYWVVVFKALVTVHHLMSYDKTARDFSMPKFIRRYSRYINEKALSYRLLAFDFCKVKRGNEGVLRIMPIDRLLKTLPILQNQLDALLEFDCNANDLNNGVINACFMLLFRDLIGLFACHNDGIINLLNKYFTLNRKMCREAFDLYKKFLVRMDKVSDFLRVAEVVGIDKEEIPDLRRAPSSLIEALEQHLQNIESNKKILKQQPSNSGKQPSSSSDLVLGSLTPPSSRRPNSPSNSAIAAMTTSSGCQSDELSISSFKDEEVRKALEEEARVLSQYGSTEGGPSKSSKSSKGSVTGESGKSSPKFAVTTIPKSIDDIFGDADAFTTSAANNNNNNNNNSNNNNGFGDSGKSTFDNLSSASSSVAKQRPDFDSIKSTITSATTTLEKSTLSGLKALAPPPGGKKASDDLFALLDTSATSAQTAGSTGGSQTVGAASSALMGIASKSAQASGSSIILANPVSPFATTSPFDILAPINPIQTNGQLTTKLKPGNPFPEVVSNDFALTNTSSAFRSITSTGAGASAFAASATPIQPSMPTSGNSVFKSTTSSSTTTMANYTNLGGLEGFGDLLQPMSSSANNNNKGINHGGPNATQSGAAKPSFNSSSGLASTGLFKGDLDSTLANLAQNLTFDGITKTKK